MFAPEKIVQRRNVRRLNREAAGQSSFVLRYSIALLLSCYSTIALCAVLRTYMDLRIFLILFLFFIFIF